MSWSEQALSKEAYQVSTEIYEGPLDLLLDLIERAELDITVLSLAKVTDQFLAYLSRIRYKEASEVSSFLVIAAKLIQIKSLALLPRESTEPAQEGEEDPGEALARQLIEYKRFKEIAGFLENRSSSNYRTYLRIATSPKIKGKVDLEGLTIQDLILAAREVFSTPSQMEPLGSIVSIPRITIHERIAFIVARLAKDRPLSFSEIISGARSRMNIVVTFLAVLELIRRRMITAVQDLLFGDIALIALPADDATENPADAFTDQF